MSPHADKSTAPRNWLPAYLLSPYVHDSGEIIIDLPDVSFGLMPHAARELAAQLIGAAGQVEKDFE